MKKKINYYNTGHSYLVTHPKRGLISPCPCGIVTLRWTRFLKFRRWEKVSKREKISETGLESKERKLEEYENENHYLLWWSDMRHFPYNCLGLSDEDNSVSRTDNFVNVFNSVTSPRVLSYRCVLHYFLTISVGFNLTFRFKPKVGGIKIVRPCLQMIHFPSWVAHILCFQPCSSHSRLLTG